MKKVVILLSVFCILFCVSCKTGETKTEYIPVTLDIETLMEPITELRPEEVQLIDAPIDLSDIMQNSVSFQYAYENWRNYALTLEQFYYSLIEAQETLSSST